MSARATDQTTTAEKVSATKTGTGSTAKSATNRTGGRVAGGQSVQSVERAFAILETMADEGGVMGISHLAEEVGLPLPTIHRLTRTLVKLGYLHQDPSRRYVLGPRLMRLGEQAASVLTVFARPHLLDLVDQLGETSNMARLDGHQMVYLAQMPSRHSMRMFTEVGKRVSPHSTAVGKATLANLPEARVREILKRAGMPAHTDLTLTDPDAYVAHLDIVRQRGYAIDDGEQELGVRCIAVALPDAPAPIAISISGPASRITDDLIESAVERLHAAAGKIVAEIR